MYKTGVYECFVLKMFFSLSLWLFWLLWLLGSFGSSGFFGFVGFFDFFGFVGFGFLDILQLRIYLQVVPGQAGGGSFKLETPIAYRAEQRLWL